MLIFGEGMGLGLTCLGLPCSQDTFVAASASSAALCAFCAACAALAAASKADLGKCRNQVMEANVYSMVVSGSHERW